MQGELSKGLRRRLRRRRRRRGPGAHPELGLELALGDVEGLGGAGEGQGGGPEAVDAAHAHVGGEAAVVLRVDVGRAEAEGGPVLVDGLAAEVAAVLVAEVARDGGAVRLLALQLVHGAAVGVPRVRLRVCACASVRACERASERASERACWLVGEGMTLESCHPACASMQRLPQPNHAGARG